MPSDVKTHTAKPKVVAQAFSPTGEAGTGDLLELEASLVYINSRPLRASHVETQSQDTKYPLLARPVIITVMPDV